jgi:hypothetical protein
VPVRADIARAVDAGVPADHLPEPLATRRQPDPALRPHRRQKGGGVTMSDMVDERLTIRLETLRPWVTDSW